MKGAERSSVMIFATKCFSVCENVRHDITPLSSCRSWSMSIIIGVSVTHHNHTPPKQRRPSPIQRVLGEDGGGGTVLISSKMGQVSTATAIPRCLPKSRRGALCETTKQHQLS